MAARLEDVRGEVEYKLASGEGTHRASVASRVRLGDGSDGHPLGEPYRWIAPHGQDWLGKLTQRALDAGEVWPVEP